MKIIDLLIAIAVMCIIIFMFFSIIWGLCSFNDRDDYNALVRVKQKHGIILNFEKLAYLKYKERWRTLSFSAADCFFDGTSAYLLQFFISTEERTNEDRYDELCKIKYLNI